MPRNTSVTLGDHFDKFIAENIAKGRFLSVSEVVRAGLRTLEREEAKLESLRAQLALGAQSPIVENFEEEEFLKQLREKHLK